MLTLVAIPPKPQGNATAIANLITTGQMPKCLSKKRCPLGIAKELHQRDILKNTKVRSTKCSRSRVNLTRPKQEEHLDQTFSQARVLQTFER